MSTRKQATLRETTVGRVRSEVLAFTVGDDPRLDLALVAADCLGSAAHATMLSRLPARVRPFGVSGRRALIRELRRIMVAAREGRFTITAADQDVHLAVERELTQRLGVLGKQIHTARSRNDQIAVDLRLLAREQLLGLVADTGRVAAALLALARRGRRVPMVGRTHLQPAMTSSVGLWAAAYAESLFDDITLLRAAYALNDACPLGAAAGYGVPWPVDRSLTARLLGFRRPVHNVLHAIQARGKVEGAILAACAQVMVSLSRLAQDLMIFTLPEFVRPGITGPRLAVIPPSIDPLSVKNRPISEETMHEVLAAFGIDPDAPVVKWAMQLARTAHKGTGAVSFATEASVFQRIGIPTVVMGPGSIDQAHKPDEFITYEQVAACEAFFARLVESRPPA